MSKDPYHAVEREIQASFQAAAQLHASFIRIRSTAREDSEELGLARSEVTTIALRFIAIHSDFFSLISYKRPLLPSKQTSTTSMRA